MPMSERATYMHVGFSGPGRPVTLTGGAGSASAAHVYWQAACVHRPTNLALPSDTTYPNFTPMPGAGQPGTLRLLRAEIDFQTFTGLFEQFCVMYPGHEMFELWATRGAVNFSAIADTNAIRLHAGGPGTHACDIEVPPGFTHLTAGWRSRNYSYQAAALSALADGIYTRSLCSAMYGFELA